MPIIITIVLALGAYQLSTQKARIKDLNTAETLGSVTVIATDKTGTLTMNQMQLVKLYVDDKLFDLNQKELCNIQRFLFEIGAITNDIDVDKKGSKPIYKGDPMEIAMIKAAEDHGIIYQDLQKKYVLQNEFSFDMNRMLMSQVFQKENDKFLFLKGAPESNERTTKIFINNGEKILDPNSRQKILENVQKMAEEVLRIIAFAFRELSDINLSQDVMEKECVFLGLAGFLDPPRHDVKEAILACKSAGIKVIIISGDYPLTVKAIAEQVGIESEHWVLGKEVEKMDRGQLINALNTSSIFARTPPEQKLKIVEVLKDSNEIVAVTGDGVNDAPALKKADIGIAMGLSGTDVAKEAADMILLDDNFATITLAVEQGRKLYNNLRKGVRYYLSVKLALIAIFLLPILFNIALPFAPIQIILLELFIDLAASATFVLEPSEIDVMKTSPRKLKLKFMDYRMQLWIYLGALSLITSVLTIYLFYTVQGLPQAKSMAFATWMVCHVFLAFNMRTERDPISKLGLLSNVMIYVWAILAMVVLLLIIYVPPLQMVFKLTSLNALDWIIILLVSFATTFWMEIVKIAQNHRVK